MVVLEFSKMGGFGRNSELLFLRHSWVIEMFDDLQMGTVTLEFAL